MEKLRKRLDLKQRLSKPPHSNLRTLEREGEVGEFPNAAVIIVEDLVLAVVLPHVRKDELVIDNCGSDRLLVLLNLLLLL